MATQIGTLTVKMKIVGPGGKRRVAFLSFLARLMGVKLVDIREESDERRKT